MNGNWKSSFGKNWRAWKKLDLVPKFGRNGKIWKNRPLGSWMAGKFFHNFQPVGNSNKRKTLMSFPFSSYLPSSG
jgi:hypothetical protein